jgi:hypothetical protein
VSQGYYWGRRPPLVGDTHTIQALNSAGQPVTGLTWTSSDTDVVSLSSADPPVFFALAAGHVTITAAETKHPALPHAETRGFGFSALLAARGGAFQPCYDRATAGLQTTTWEKSKSERLELCEASQQSW